MITSTINPKTLDRCCYCRRPILTAFVTIPAVRGTDLIVTAHARCAEIKAADLTDTERDAAQTANLANIDAIAAMFTGGPGIRNVNGDTA